MDLSRRGRSKLGRKYLLRPTPRGHPFVRSSLPLVLGSPLFPKAPAGWTCDYRSLWLACRNQGNEGSCGAHAWAALKELQCVFWWLRLHGWQPGQPIPEGTKPLGGYLSVAHLYWLIRLVMHTFPSDSGTDNAAAGEAMQRVGVCPESWLPYTANPAQAGNAGCDAAGAPYRIHQGVRVPLDVDHIAAALYGGHGVVVAFRVFESFEETGSDGMVPPLGKYDTWLGDHDTAAAALRPDGLVSIRGSWGPWGDNGYCHMAPEYLAQVGLEAWTCV